MKISKTKFFNYMRCNRYVALEELVYQRSHAVISFDESLEDLYTKELEDKKDELMQHLFEAIHYSENDFEDDQDFDPLNNDEKNQLFRLLQPQYELIELLSAEKIKSLFGGEVIYSRDTFSQKYIQKEVEGFYFFAFLDAFQEDEKNMRIIETKASTTKKFFDVGYSKDKVFYSIFHEDDQGIYHLKKELNLPYDEKKYNEQYKKLRNKYDAVGKYVYDLAYQRYIHESKPSVNKKREYYLAVLNHNYVYDGSKASDGSAIYSSKDIIRLIDLTEVTKELLPIIDFEIKQIVFRLNQMQASPVPLGVHCQKGKSARECPFISVCLKDKGVPEVNSLFVYRNSHYPFVENKDSKSEVKHGLYELINEGVTGALDIDREWLSKVQKMQYDVIASKIPFSDIKRIREGIKQLKYPLYHLDFESFASPLPRYEGEKPYQQSLFQFSLHVEYKDKKINKDDNYYFLAKDHDDHREELVKKMIEYIPMDGGNVIVYNKGFESGRINELIKLFPEYDKELKNIQNRIFDLLYLVRGNQKFYEDLGFSKDESAIPVYYDEKFQRSYSIKQVLPVFVPELDYKKLEEVQNGQQAQIAYYQMPMMSDDDRIRTYKNMLEYCKQDTWAMVEILKSVNKCNKTI